MGLLLPHTDGGGVAQLVVVIFVGAGAVLALRHRPATRLVAIAQTLVALGLMGVRALH
ncbi:MAG: hypothetical protein OES13_04790 [Acidimicrobiia bacterium]|nr:hypothetical protein [Acidimicrobiia bacterium]